MKWWFGRLLAIFLLATVVAPQISFADSADAENSAKRISLGPVADRLLDVGGTLGIEDVANERNGAKFIAADGKIPNYGVRKTPASVLWLRVKIPDIEKISKSDWALSLREPRVNHVDLYFQTAAGWHSEVSHVARALPGSSYLLRYPIFLFPAGDIAGRTLYLRIETPSSMRGTLWLETAANLIGDYSSENLRFGILFGVLIALLIYIVAIGVVLRDGALLSLAVIILGYLGYVAGDRAFIETQIWPGATLTSRLLSFPGANLIFAGRIAFELYYLRVNQHFPVLARSFVIIFVALAVIAGCEIWEVITDGFLVREIVPYVGLSVYVLHVVLGVIMLPKEWRRVLAFTLCWSPALIGASMRLLLDIHPIAAANLAWFNNTYFVTGLSLLLFSILASLDIQARERKLRNAVENSEARFRSFADAASDDFWETDASGAIIHAAGPTTKTIGLISGEVLANALRKVAGGPFENSMLSFSLAQREPFRSLVMPLNAADGPRYVSLSGTPVFADNGDFAGFRGIATDVTEETLRREHEMTQQKMAAIGQLAGGIAHELNNLLHPILNLSRRVALQFAPQDERRRQLDIVIDASTLAGEIVSSVLTYVRTDSNASNPVVFAEGVRRATETIKPIIPDSVRYIVEIELEEGPIVPSGELFQVLSNLVANAVHATGGVGTIKVTVKPDHPSASAAIQGAILTVSDDGMGMDSATRDRAFEPFFTTKEVGRGTGLGLPIVYGIVSRWGGTIDIESEPGTGSRIVIHLPARSVP